MTSVDPRFSDPRLLASYPLPFYLLDDVYIMPGLKGRQTAGKLIVHEQGLSFIPKDGKDVALST